ncbi:MAG: SRPBCC domain-containing protein [Gammaproteobacteria bacterium]|nr:SRPBCC domain-containing protein [Gammaproteobacteria bacterium]
MTDLTVRIDKTVNAPIEKVFDAWLDPALLTQFILPAPGMSQPEVENDPREGGNFTIVMHVGDDRVPHSGSYLAIDRPNRLKFSWESPYSTDDSAVTLEFRAVDANTTEVTLTHVKFLHEEARSDHEGGWSNILDKLGEVL